MKPKFEEKTFESYFNTELDRRASIYFAFGQFQEGFIGADAAGFSKNRWLWRRLGYGYFFRLPFAGADLREVADEMEYYLRRRIQNIPSMKSNLLFQYKRPELITSKRGSEWSHWKQSYFRYDIDKEQQALLAHIAAKFGTKALVLYASPALEDIEELIKAKQDGNLIEKTNFRRASELTGHHRNTYIQAGTHSYACSDPERIENFNLLELLEQQQPIEDESPETTVLTFTEGVTSALTENTSFGNAYQTLLQPLIEGRFEESHPYFFSIMSMTAVRDITGIQWVLLTTRE